MNKTGILRDNPKKAFEIVGCTNFELFEVYHHYEYGHDMLWGLTEEYAKIKCNYGKLHYTKISHFIHKVEHLIRQKRPLNIKELGICKCPKPISKQYNPLGRTSGHSRRFRQAVFERDNYTCQCCGKIDADLRAHHLDGWEVNRELCFDWNNGITLCDGCHDKGRWRSFHSFYYENAEITREKFRVWLIIQRKWLVAKRLYLQRGNTLPEDDINWSTILEEFAKDLLEINYPLTKLELLALQEFQSVKVAKP